MELLSEIKNIQYTVKNLRYYGYILSGFLLLLGISAVRKNHESQIYIYFFSGLLIATITLLNPMLLKPLYRIWMTVALCIGMVVSRLFLTIIFICAFCTTSAIGKLFGKKFLPLQTNTTTPSYWIPKKYVVTKESYEKQY